MKDYYEWNAMNKARIRILNVCVYQKLLHDAEQLECFAAKTSGVGAIDVVLKPELHLGRICFTIPRLEILPDWLLRIITEDADECEAYEISSGEQRLCVTFHRLFNSI